MTHMLSMTPVNETMKKYCSYRRRILRLMPVVFLFLSLAAAVSVHAEDKTRGVGTYPGRMSEAFVPQVINSVEARRNMAQFHTVHHSSCYDYNLTGQLLTDGIVTSSEPAYVEVLVNGENLPKNEREYSIDGTDHNKNVVAGDKVSLRINWYGMRIDADSVEVNCTVAYRKDKAAGGYEMTIGDGEAVFSAFRESAPSGRERNDGLSSLTIIKGCSFSSAPLSTFCLDLAMDGAESWTISLIKFFKDGRVLDTELLPISRFQSVWMSETGGEQWCYVDLGDGASLDEVGLYWIGHAPKGRVEVSEDARIWTAVADLPTGELCYKVPVIARGRYVRVVAEGQDEPYLLSEFEVWGVGGTSYVCAPAPQVEGNVLSLNGGDWRLRRALDENWLPATVPGTVLTSYLNVGAVPDPNYDNNNDYISESYFCSDFVYQREFVLPKEFLGKNVFLNFDGVNWKARVYLNGEEIGRVEGAFMRGKMDVTSKLQEGRNVLVVEVERPAHPGATKEKDYFQPSANGGLLGKDNPTFHASVGWDWIPTVRGREVGIWNNVHLSAEEGLSLSDPLVSTSLNLPDTLVTMTPEVFYDNFSGGRIEGTIHGQIGPVTFQKEVSVDPGTGVFTFRPEDWPELNNVPLRLWWPNGYGEPYLYDASFCFVSAEADTLSVVNFKYGARELSYEDVDSSLKIYVNGRRVVPLGGNWGFPEQNLNFRGREYDISVRYHKDMNFNMIRNWVGQTGDEAFYCACDRYGIMVWQDFWLANPYDGPDPDDETLFGNNAFDYVSKIRRHPSVVLYCGRNEGYPPKTLEDRLRSITSSLHPGIVYISSSADDGVSGHGPYWALPAKDYFENQTGMFHSERGMPCIMTFESLRRAMREESQWPQNEVWGRHDYTMNGFQNGTSFNSMVSGRFGEPSSAEQFSAWAQLVNYEGYRAMFESEGVDRMGLLIWMSHSCWPSLCWHCYDYYFEPTAAYFGCRKACEPVHIQYNASNGRVEIVNIGVGDRKGLKARIETYNLEGGRLLKKGFKVNSGSDSTVELPEVEKIGEGAVLRLSLRDKNGLVSENTYILADKLTDLSMVEVGRSVSGMREVGEGEREALVTVENKGDRTAYLLRLNLVDGEGEQILPVRYSDNYFHLLPHESRTVTVRWAEEDQMTGDVDVLVGGLNVFLHF